MTTVTFQNGCTFTLVIQFGDFRVKKKPLVLIINGRFKNISVDPIFQNKFSCVKKLDQQIFLLIFLFNLPIDYLNAKKCFNGMF